MYRYQVHYSYLLPFWSLILLFCFLRLVGFYMFFLADAF